MFVPVLQCMQLHTMFWIFYIKPPSAMAPKSKQSFFGVILFCVYCV
jgi:hypothetical protein